MAPSSLPSNFKSSWPMRSPLIFKLGPREAGVRMFEPGEAGVPATDGRGCRFLSFNMRPPDGSIQPNWETWNRRASSLGEALKLRQGIGPARLPFHQLDAERNCWFRVLDRRAHAISRDAVNMARRPGRIAEKVGDCPDVSRLKCSRAHVLHAGG